MDLRWSHKDKDGKSQKRNTYPVSKSRDEFRANDSKAQLSLD